VAFAVYGSSLISNDGNRKENYRYGKLVVILQEKLMAREYDCRVMLYVYVLLDHWQEPLQKSVTPLLSAHSVGMEMGDIDCAFQGAGSYLTYYWYNGVSVHYVVNCKLWPLH
jgi:predicted ATPase